MIAGRTLKAKQHDTDDVSKKASILDLSDEMIALTRFNGTTLYLNADLVQVIEGTPDTVITLSNNVKIVVRENVEEVIEKIITYQQRVRNPSLRPGSGE
jgi:flagellar protein FlbD